MNTPKEVVQRLLSELPDEVSFEDIQYHIYVQEAVQRGLDAVERGEVVDQEEIERRMAQWIGE
jgi:predicted transcriptional regulator